MKKINYKMSIYQKKYRYAKEEKETPEIEITSLLDILVILLFFLIKNYNASNLKLELPEKLDVPYSTSTEMGNHAVIVKIDRDENIYINDDLVGTTDILETKFATTIATMREESRGRFIASQGEKTGKSVDSSIIMNVVLDKELEYRLMDRLMQVAAQSGYEHFKFIVRSED